MTGSIPSQKGPDESTTTSPADCLSSTEKQPESHEDDQTYLEMVKLTFSDQPQVYSTFLKIIQEFKSKSLDSSEVVNRVFRLFNGYPLLIVGFKKFLQALKGEGDKQVNDESTTTSPADSLISTQKRPENQGLTVEDAENYLKMVKLNFSSQPKVYSDFLDILQKFKTKSLDSSKVIDRVLSLFNGYPLLIVGFKKCLQALKVKGDNQVHDESTTTTPADSLISTQERPENQPLTVEDAENYLKMVQLNFSSQPKVYNDFLNILQKLKTKSLGMSEVNARVLSLLKGYPQLIDGFKKFLPPIEVKRNEQSTKVVSLQKTTEMKTSPLPSTSTSELKFVQLSKAPTGNRRLLLKRTIIRPDVKVPTLVAVLPIPPPSLLFSDKGDRSHHEWRELMDYLTKLKNRFANQTEIYKPIKSIVQNYLLICRKEDKVMPVVFSQLKALFQHHSDLLAELIKFFPELISHETPLNPHEDSVAMTIPEASGDTLSTGLNPSAAASPSADNNPIISISSDSSACNTKTLKRSSDSPNQSGPSASPKKRKLRSVSPVSSDEDDDFDIPNDCEVCNKNPHEDSVAMTIPEASGDTLSTGLNPSAAASPSADNNPIISISSDSSASNTKTLKRSSDSLDQSGPSASPKKRKLRSVSPASSDEDDDFDIPKDCEFFYKGLEVLHPNTHTDLLRCLKLFVVGVVDWMELLTLVTPLLSPFKDLLLWFREFVWGVVCNDLIAPDINYNVLKPLEEGSSYRVLPSSHSQVQCSGRTALCNEVLNDSLKIFPRWSQESTSTASNKSRFTRLMFGIEDERYEVDLVLDLNSHAINMLKAVAKKLERMTTEEKAQFRLDDCLDGSSILHQMAIMRIYGKTFGPDIIEWLKIVPEVAVPIVLKRLKAKDEEWRKALKSFNKMWKKDIEMGYNKEYPSNQAPTNQMNTKERKIISDALDGPRT